MMRQMEQSPSAPRGTHVLTPQICDYGILYGGNGLTDLIKEIEGQRDVSVGKEACHQA